MTRFSAKLVSVSTDDIFALDDGAVTIRDQVDGASSIDSSLPLNNTWAGLSLIFREIGIEPLNYLLGLDVVAAVDGIHYTFLMPDEVRAMATRLEHSHIHEVIAAECDPEVLAFAHPDKDGSYWSNADECARLIQFIEPLRAFLRHAANTGAAVLACAPQETVEETPVPMMRVAAPRRASA